MSTNPPWCFRLFSVGFGPLDLKGAVGAMANSPPACAGKPTALAQVPPVFSNLFESRFQDLSTLDFNKRIQTLAQNIHECRTKVKLLFLQGKMCKITTFFICRGFCRDPLPCSGFILCLHFAGGKAGAGSLLYKPYQKCIGDSGSNILKS